MPFLAVSFSPGFSLGINEAQTRNRFKRFTDLVPTLHSNL